MLRLLRLLFVLTVRSLYSRRGLLLENLALRQQLAVLRKRHPRVRFSDSDRLFWTALLRLWSKWKRALVLVQPETVVRWHRIGFKLYWKWISRHRARAGRRCVSGEVKELIFRMVAENSTWGAPRIHGELKMLGFGISERTVPRSMRKAPRNPEPAKRWAAFLNNHREAIAAMDFFTVPTLTFGVLQCFFVIAHDRRRVLHFSITRHPSSAWISQQLRETFPYDEVPTRSELQRGSCQHDEELRHPTQADQLPQSLAERCCRTLGWELQAGFTRSCHRAQRTASETADDRLRSLLPRGSDAPRLRVGWQRRIQ